MFDPGTITVAVTTATSAFNAIKRAMDAGREVESISKDLNRWMSAVSDVDNIKKQSENPTFFRKILSGNQIEQMAFESIRAKKALEDQRATLKNYIMFKMGTRFWEDLLAEEGRLRKLRQEQIYAKQQLKEKIIMYSVLSAAIVVGCGILYYFTYGLVLLDRGELG
tara:strand:+ start:115 stop:612 length:498 start_codon:yes stop_codon:yes gene_type:complete